MIIIDDIEQGTIEWKLLKAGVISVSNMSKIITTKGKPSTTATSYRHQLLAEMLAGPQPGHSSPAMEEGLRREEEARDFYEFHTGNKLNQVAFIFKDERKLVGCSPDGMIEGMKRGFEMKNPQGNTQVKYLLDGKLPTAYYQQVQGSMYVTGYEEWDFLSYVPEMPHLLITVEKDVEFHKQLDIQLASFIEKLLKDKEQLNKLKG